MNISLEIKLAKEKVFKEGIIREMFVDYMADKEIYHTVAILIFSEVYGEDEETSKGFIYDNKFYSKYLNEKNPFNDDFID
jgi:hypothetical protein